MSAATKSQPLTRAELDSLVAAGALHVPLTTVARALGMGETACRTAALAGGLPVRTFTVGHRTRAVLADLVDLLTGRGDSEGGVHTDAAVAHPGPDASEDQSDARNLSHGNALRSV